MARLASVAKMGYYPTPEMSQEHIRSWIGNKHSRMGRFHYLDPCCGEGYALRSFVNLNNYTTKIWGIELDTERAITATNSIPRVIQCSIFDARVNPLSSIGLLFLNPPYDTEEGERVEMKFLKHSLKWLCPDGILIFIVPEHILTPDNITWIGEHLYDITVVKLHRDDYPQFKQVVLFAKKRPQRVEDAESFQPPYHHIEDIEPKAYYVPSTEGPSVFQGSVSVTDEEIEKYRPNLIKKIKEIVSENEKIKSLSPLLPLRKGHLVALITAGMLDGKIEKPGEGFIVVKGFSERISSTRTENDKEITKDTYSVGIRVMEQGGKWYDIR